MHFTNSGAKPGDTIWIRGGRYNSSEFRSSLRGEPDKPITVRGFPNERVTLVSPASSWAMLITENPNVVYRDFELVCEDLNRTARRVAGLYGYAANTKYINLVFRDVGEIGIWSSSNDTTFYGCIVLNTGWQPAGERGHGHGFYMQGDVGTKKVENNFILNTYGYGIHAYSQSGQLKNFVIAGNTIARSGSLALPINNDEANILIGGTQNPAENIKIIDNVLYHSLSQDATNAYLYYQAKNKDLEFSGNYVAGGSYGAWLQDWATIKGSNNTVVGNGTLLVMNLGVGNSTTNYAWDNNNYYLVSGNAVFSPFYFKGGSAGNYNFSTWVSLSGLDKNSSFIANPNKPANYVAVRPNVYEEGRASITVINWSGGDKVDIDVSKVLKANDKFIIVKAEDFYGSPVASGVYSGSQVSVPLSGELNTFVLRKI